MPKNHSQLKKFEIDVCQEKAGFLDLEEGEEVTQQALRDAVDITSATKSFELKLRHGPYKVDYTRNGRHLLIGGKRGHLAAFDWQTKKLMFEIGLKMDQEEEVVRAIKWLHKETMFAVAQKQWTFIYDNQGTELHCLKSLDSVLQLEFLPHHFLLVASNARSYLSWLDVSVGKKVAGFTTGLGRLDVMTQNPQNAIICLGHAGGTVTMWSPNMKEPLIKMLCHGSGTKSIAIDPTGVYMATSGMDRQLKIWDLRMGRGLLHKSHLKYGASHLDFSQRGLLAASLNNVVNVYSNATLQPVVKPYLSHTVERSSIDGLSFCPYEDVLALGHTGGMQSLLVPGAGEPNFDALEANPYQTKQQRNQMEVKMLLDKVQPELITLDTSELSKVNVKSLKEELEEKAKLKFLKPRKIEFEPKFKKKGKSKAGKRELRKQGVKDEAKVEFMRTVVEQKQKEGRDEAVKEKRTKKPSVLDRFK